jgi:hypothetical protein
MSISLLLLVGNDDDDDDANVTFDFTANTELVGKYSCVPENNSIKGAA